MFNFIRKWFAPLNSYFSDSYIYEDEGISRDWFTDKDAEDEDEDEED